MSQISEHYCDAIIPAANGHTAYYCPHPGKIQIGNKCFCGIHRHGQRKHPSLKICRVTKRIVLNVKTDY